MAPMSRGVGEVGTSRLARVADFSAKILVPLGASLTLLAIVTGSAREVDHDLRLIAPDRLSRGQSLPVRAQLYAGLHRKQGAEMIAPPVGVELHASNGRLLARGQMRPSYAHTLEAMLALPDGYQGSARLTALARVQGVAPRSERVVALGEPAARERLAVRPRALPPLQSFAAGPVHTRAPEQPAPDALELAIVGGACVPEQPCELRLYVGVPAASVRLLASAALTPEAASAKPSAVTSAVVAWRAVLHGPEAEARVVVEREGIEVATRAFRIAVALGANVARELAPVLEGPAAPAIALRGDERGCIVDAFREQRWLRTGSLRDCLGDEALPFAALEPGLWRMQLRRDPFASGGAAVVGVYVKKPGETAAAALAALADAVLDQTREHKLARAVREQPEAFAAQLDVTASALLAELDTGIIDLPEPVSGYPLAMLQLGVARARLRKLALFVLALCALSVGLLVVQRGLAAAAEAGRLMAEAGEEPNRLARQRLRMTLRILATVISLLLAFAAIAVYIVARGAQ
jgi:hypothetical protein